MIYLAALLASYYGMDILVPILQKISIRVGFVDKPNERKIHKEPIPLLGGLGMYIVFVVLVVLVMGLGKKVLGILLASFIIVSVGLLDDWYKSQGKDLKAFPKFITQIGAAFLISLFGIRIFGITNPFSGNYIQFPLIIQYVSTIIWIFGVTTVINFIDGMDGLASGLTSISSLTLFIVALVMEQPISALFAIVLCGISLGFLKHNKYPAKIFMGDAGATFLGFILGIIAVDGAFKSATLFSLFIPVMALALPIFDNIFVVINRAIEGKPVYMADNKQIHFRLLRLGLNQQQTVAVLYVVSLFFSLTSIILLLIEKRL